MATQEGTSVKKNCYDPGWNDPPTFSYDSRTSQLKNEKRGKLLNKRIAFPLHSSNIPTDTKTRPIDPTLPPLPVNLANLPPPPSSGFLNKLNSNIEPTKFSESDEANEETSNFKEEVALQIVLDNFNEILERKSDNEELKEKESDIRRRLDEIKKMWEDDKFDVLVKQKIFELSEAIKLENKDRADHLQKCLMVDHVSLCSPWMAGVRHILHFI